jgi:hypothetical protein
MGHVSTATIRWALHTGNTDAHALRAQAAT